MSQRLVRFTYWAGAAIDVLAGIQLLMPEHMALLGFQGMRPSGVAAMPAITAAVLMFGFTAILMWAGFCPVERRFVLLVTLGVIVTLASVNVMSGVMGWQSWDTLIAPLLIQTVLTTLFTTSYVIAGRMRSEVA